MVGMCQHEGLHTTRARVPPTAVGFKRPMVGMCQHEGLHTTCACLPQTPVGFEGLMFGSMWPALEPKFDVEATVCNFFAMAFA